MTKTRPPVRVRALVLSILSSLGLVAYLPALRANVAPAPEVSTLVPWVVAGAVLVTLAAIAGLRFADAAGLPMPWLRRMEGIDSPPARRRDLVLVAVGSAIAGVAAVAVLRGFAIKNLQGSLGARLLTTLFAAVTLEIVIHLFVMSGVVRWTRSLVAGLATSTLLFVFFHAGGALAEPLPIAASVVMLNAALGLLLGVAYARAGFEAAILGHAIAHAIAITFG